MIGPGDATRRNSLTEKPFHLLLKRTGEYGRIVLLAVRASFTSDQACCIREQKKQPVDCACFVFFFSSSCGGKGEAEGKGRGRERERETAEVRAEKVLVAANFGKKGYESESYTI